MTPTDARVFTLPDLGEGLQEAEIVRWRVEVGDTVGVDTVVVEVETAKATVEIPCPYAGEVRERSAQTGDVVRVGQSLLSVCPDPAGASAAGGNGREAHRSEEQAGSGNVLVGFGTGVGEPGRRSRRSLRAEPERSPAAGAPRRREAPRVISPLVRRLAAEAGLDLHTISGSGIGGVIRRRDVDTALAMRRAQGGVAGARGDEQRIPLRGIRRTVADTVSRSRREIPDVTVWVDADATELLAARHSINAGSAADVEPVSVLALLARITMHALGRFPQLNARVETDDDGRASEVVQLGQVDLGVAAQTEQGLVVPVVQGASSMSTRQLQQAIGDATGKARAGTLAPADVTGGTFTLNNYGVFGVDGSTPIINYPEAALLGVGRITDKPWVVDGELAVRSVVQLCLVFDHRVCDGGVAGGFLRLVADCVERPSLLLAEL